MPHSEKIPLKTFWEKVEQRLSACSTDELRAILRTMAQETPPTQRQAFLDKLKSMTKKTAAAVEKALGQEQLLTDIDKLVDEIEAATKDAEFREEYNEWDDYYDDEDSPGHYEEFVEPLTALFDRTQAVFDYANPVLARAAYRKLFAAFSFEDDYGGGLHECHLSNVDMGEACARYLRAVYETEPSVRQPEELFDQMQQVGSWFAGSRPMVDDIIQVSPKPLPDMDHFFRDWIVFLGKQSGSDADTWLREAIRLSLGTQGLEELVRKEGSNRPHAYLDWFTALEKEGRHREVLDAAKEALQTLDAKLHIRAAVADHLYAAASKLNDRDTQRTARMEAFLIEPALVRLLDLWETTPDEERSKLMQQAAQHAKEFLAHQLCHSENFEEAWVEDLFEKPRLIDKSVLAHSYLLAGEWDAAHELAAPEEVLGWSSPENSQGLVVPFFLVMLSYKRLDSLPPNLAQIWRLALLLRSGLYYWDEEDEGRETSTFERLKCTYAERLAALDLDHDKQEQFLSWCLEVAKNRVNTIVGKKYRKSYEKAATLIAACSEVLKLRGDAEGMEEILNETRGRFPRHRSFQAALTKQLTK